MAFQHKQHPFHPFHHLQTCFLTLRKLFLDVGNDTDTSIGMQALTQNPELFNMVVRRSQVPATGEERGAGSSPRAADQEQSPNYDCRVN